MNASRSKQTPSSSVELVSVGVQAFTLPVQSVSHHVQPLSNRVQRVPVGLRRVSSHVQRASIGGRRVSSRVQRASSRVQRVSSRVQLASVGLQRVSSRARASRPLVHVSTESERTPNHALQRTAPAVTLAASGLRLSPTMQPARQPPPSLSLGSLGVLRPLFRE